MKTFRKGVKMKEQEGVCWEIVSYAPDRQEVCLAIGSEEDRLWGAGARKQATASSRPPWNSHFSHGSC